MEVLKDQIVALLDQNFLDSAQILSSFLVSSPGSNLEANFQSKAEHLILLGDTFFQEKEFRRAIHTYRQALHCSKMPQKQTSATLKSSPLHISFPSNTIDLSTFNENEVKFKIASCHSALNESRLALIELESIPSKTRTMQMNLLVAKLYRNLKHNRFAIVYYKECLRQCPYLIEAAVALAGLGVSAKDIISCFPQAPNRSARALLDPHDTNNWFPCYVEAQCCVAANDYQGGLELYAQLSQHFPNNIHILLEIAKVQAITGKNEEAIMNFEKARSLDPYVITYMDEYAMLLKEKSDHLKLNKLVHDLLNIDPARAEVFVALSVLWERKDEVAALSYAEKSTKIDERHIPAYIMKGNLQLLLRRPDPVLAFREAHDLRPDIRSYQGLVRSYLAISKTKEALHAAREAMKAMPHSAKAVKLVGDVHASNLSGREKAKKLYESALRMDPEFFAAAFALADLHVAEGQHGDAIGLLQQYLEYWADDSVHVKLAQVLVTKDALQDALSHFQAALRINSQNEDAKKGLERLDKQMKGVDPDAPEEEEEEEEEINDDDNDDNADQDDSDVL